jgi:eukaryotic-like serine/threonine-protein kinase
MSLVQQRTYCFGEFELNVGSRSLSRQGEPIPLGSKAFEVLTCLVSRAGQVVTKDEMLRTVWPDSFVEESNLAQQVFALRKALGDDAASIKTIPGKGYQFVGAVRELEFTATRTEDVSVVAGDPLEGVTIQRTRESTRLIVEELLPSSDAASSAAAPTRRLPRRVALSLVLGAVAVIVAASFAGWRLLHRGASRPQHIGVTLADFTNSTGDPTFDRTLKRALEIDLDQSPYLGVMGDAEAVRILKMMGRKSDDPLTLEVAAEVCERGNRDVLLTGGIAQVGSLYLLTLQAADCRSCRKLASAQAKARTKEDVLGAIDTLAATMRSQLGEAASSIERYDRPIQEATTSSLEALRNFSVGEYLHAQGKEDTEILPYYQRAVQLDPNFAMAYGAMGTTYYNVSEYTLASQYYRKAFDLRRRVGAKESLIIEAHYYAEGLGDIEQGIGAYKLWAAAYPFDPAPWSNMANDYTQIGQYPPAIEAGERALQLDPGQALGYAVLMRAYRRQNRIADAKSVGMLALQRGKDSYGIHSMLYEIAHWERDAEAEARELAWGDKNSGNFYFLYVRAEAALFAGKYKEAKKLFEESHDAATREGLSEAADSVLSDLALYQLKLGMVAEARATFQRIAKPDPESPDIAILRTKLGDAAYGKHFLDRQQAKENLPTLLKYYQIPLVIAAISMQESRPLDAVAALEAARPYELSGFDVLKARGEAYLLANQPKAAAVEFQKIVDHYGIDVISPEIPLAHLGLARAYAMAGDSAAGRSEYEKFFALWKDADLDVPELIAARGEYARLSPQ